jgi:homoserine O-acetyltransferase
MDKHTVKFAGKFALEAGGCLDDIEVTFHTLGKLTDRSRVVWICHALTANSDVEDWWPGMTGDGKFFNGNDYFVVCANVLGSCYGSTGPLTVSPATGRPPYSAFPPLTVRDMVKAHDLLRQHLNINSVYAVVGSSIGGFQAIEFACLIPDKIEHLLLIATNCRITPWATAFNEAQRMSIFADKSYFADIPTGGLEGMKAARAMALLSYRSYEGYNRTQSETDDDTLFADRAASYERYQGEKLAARFNAFSYVAMTKALDSHNIGRNRGGVEKALSQIETKTLLVGIDSDLLFPASELKYMQRHIPNSRYAEISSAFGHDGFLLESEQLSKIMNDFFGK